MTVKSAYDRAAEDIAALGEPWWSAWQDVESKRVLRHTDRHDEYKAAATRWAELQSGLRADLVALGLRKPGVNAEGN